MILNTKHSVIRNNHRMNTAFFRHHSQSENIEITFEYKNDAFGIDRIFNFQRSRTELIEITIGRIRTNFEKIFKKTGGGKKKNKTDGVTVDSGKSSAVNVTIQLLRNGQAFGKNLTWANLFTGDGDATDLVLKVLDDDYIVTYNYPYIGQFTLPSIIMVGYQCYPAKCEVFFAKRENCLFEWFRTGVTDESTEAPMEWQKCGESFFYDVKAADVRHRIKVRVLRRPLTQTFKFQFSFQLICTPRDGEICGRPVELIGKLPVDAGPGFCAFAQKQLFTPNRLPVEGGQFRIMSYNLLANYYCDSDFSRKELFPYCPPFALDIDYRKLLFIREIIGYHSDICCLQEVDAKVYNSDLKVCLGYHNYDGTMQIKGDTAEGLATFYHLSKFSLHAKYGINLSEHLKEQPYFSELYAKIAGNAKLCERMLSLSTALQVTVLKCIATEKYLIVANTHLYFHPDADHIRVLQIAFFMMYVRHVHQNTLDELHLSDDQIAILFCGDFNSVPECGIFKLMTEKCVPEDFIDFRSST